MKIVRFHFLGFLLTGFLTGCASLTKMVPAPQSVTRTADNPTPRFIEGIEIQPETESFTLKTNSSGKTAASPVFQVHKERSASAIEWMDVYQFKYALRLNVDVELLQNQSLYRFIDQWWQVPYKMGGSTQGGIDCSAFAQTLMSAVYGVGLPRTSREQIGVTEPVAMPEIQEGDLVFFNTRGGISHVGIYLQNNKFVHASTNSGVIISDLAEPYWNKRFVRAGRIKRT